MLSRIVVASATLLFLTACQTTGVPSADTSVPVPASSVDQKIAKVSEELAKQCALLRTATLVADAFVNKPQQEKIVAAAEAARAQFCAAPPTDLNTAILAVAQMAVEVNKVLKEQQL